MLCNNEIFNTTRRFFKCSLKIKARIDRTTRKKILNLSSYENISTNLSQKLIDQVEKNNK